MLSSFSKLQGHSSCAPIWLQEAELPARWKHLRLFQLSCSVMSASCNPMDCSTSGFPVHHQFPELTQTHFHQVGDAIQPSHPLSSPSSPAFNLSQPQGDSFSNESPLCIRWPKYWSFSFSISPSNEYSGLISFRMDWLDLLAKGLSRAFCNTKVQKHQFFGAQLSLQVQLS